MEGAASVGLHMKGILGCQSITLSRNWPFPGRGGLSRSSKAPDAKASEIQKTKPYG